MAELTSSVWHRARGELFAGLLCASAGVLLAIEPHLAALWTHGTYEFVADHDEMLYLSIARAAYYGEPVLRDPYVAPSQRVPTLYAWVQFGPLAQLARGLGLPFLALGLLWRVVGGAALGGALYAVFRRVMAPTRRPSAWAVGCALIGLADSGLADGRTLLGDVHLVRSMLDGFTPLTKPDALPQYRVVTPLLNLPAFLLLLAVACAPVRRFWWGVAMGSVFLALCVYLYFFFWTAAVMALGLFTATCLVASWLGAREESARRREAGVFAALILAGGLVLGAPAVARTVAAGSDPSLKPILERISKGYRLQPSSPARLKYVRNFWIWSKLMIGAAGLLALGVRRTGLLWCATASGYALSNSAVLTGMEFENFHWVYAHASASEVLTLATIGQVLDRAWTLQPRRLAALWLAPGTLVTVALLWRPYEALTAPEPVEVAVNLRALAPLRPALSRLGPTCVLAGPPPAVHVALLVSRCSLLYHNDNSQVVSLISDREVHERDALDAWLRGLDLPAYERLSTIDHFGYVEPDDNRWPLEQIKRERLALFRALLEGDLTLLHRYQPTCLLLPTPQRPPAAGGPWRRLEGDSAWTLWERSPSESR
jgi:hypothetical protein